MIVRRWIGNAWVVTLAYLVLAVGATWPLARVIGTEVAGDLGDPVLNCWILMWTGGQVLRFLSGHWAALGDYWNGNIFAPEKLTIAYSEHLTPQMLQILPLFALTGNIILCYNLLFLSAIVLSGVGMYLLIRELTGQPIAAIVAGAAFAFSPYRADQYAHLQVMSTQWMPLAFFAFHRYVKTGRLRTLVGAIGAVVLQALSCGYFLFYFVPFAAAYGAYVLFTSDRWRAPKVWLQIGLVSAGAALVMWPFLAPYIEVRELAQMGVRGIEEIRSYSADTWALATASETLTFWGPRLQTFQRAEGNAFPGVTIAVLGVLGIAVAGWQASRAARTGVASPRRWWRTIAAVAIGLAACFVLYEWIRLLGWQGFVWRGAWGRVSARHIDDLLPQTFLIVVLALALLPGPRKFVVSPGGVFTIGLILATFLAFGPEVTVDGHAIGAGPYAWLYNHVPGFNGMRVPSRFMMVSTLFVTALAGIGLAPLARRWPRASLPLAAVLVAAIVGESLVQPFGTNRRLWVEHFDLEARDLPRPGQWGPVYDAVAALPDTSRLAEIPFGSPPFDIRAMYFAGYHRKPLLNGYSGFFPMSFARNVAFLGFDPSDRPAAWRTLSSAGVTHVIVHESAFFEGKGEAISAWLLSQGARQVAVNGTDKLFALR